MAVTKKTVKYQAIPADLNEKIRDATGFFLEHKVAILLEENGWQVIHNRYYLDDTNPTQREMDIIAYKVSEVFEIDIYTALLISCKKSVDNNWVFLTRDNIGTRNNIGSYPLANYSNDEPIKYQMKKNQWDLDLKNANDAKFEPLRKLYGTTETIFAFREYNNSKSNIGNDTAIYESINTLLKAQAYELNTLIEGRREKPCYYSFNLLSINDVVSMVKVHCVGDGMKNSIIGQINYVNRFIVNKQVNNAVVNFVSYDYFNAELKKYEELHKQNCQIIESELNQFYNSNLFSDYSAKQLIYDKYKESLINDLHYICAGKLRGIADYQFDDLKLLYLESNNETKSFYFSIPDKKFPLLNFLNSDKDVNVTVSTWFDTFFHYKGQFSFEYDGLPF